MSSIEDIGYEIIKQPITKVRVTDYRGKWYVEYRLKTSKYALNQWWWYDDSIHSNYSDAAVRAQILVSFGYFEQLKKRKQFILEVKG